MFADKPVRFDVNVPAPEPLVVLLDEVSGLGVILQHIPLTVTEDPPSSVILPPPNAVVSVICVIESVVSVGRVGGGIVGMERLL